METTDRPLLAGLGAALRSRRQGASFSLRDLAKRAQVSERFLVQVESGSGNISVARLDDVARALGVRTSTLLLEAESSAGVERTGPEPERVVIALLGLRGAGKTTIGRRVAEALDVRFVELDAEIEQRAGMSLRELIEMHGTDFYRRTEREALKHLLERGESLVLATGGGLVTDHESYELLRREARTVWLRAKPKDHLERVMAQGDARPMANRPDAMSDLNRLLLARRALYERADVTVNTSALGLDRSVRAVLRAVRNT